MSIKIDNKLLVTPWCIELRNGVAVIVNADGEPVVCHCNITAADKNRLEKIILTINSTPDLLAACKELVAYAGRGHPINEAIFVGCLKAIQKAGK